LVALDQPGVRHNQTSAVEDVVADQAVEERLDLLAELLGFAVELGEGLGEPVCDLHVAAAHGAQQLVLVVARHAQGVAGCHHAHDQAQHAGRVGSAVDQVADEHGPASVLVRSSGTAVLVPGDRVAELYKQGLEFGAAAVNVADHLERAGLVPQVVVELGPGDRGRADALFAAQRVHGAEPLALQAFQATAQLIALPADDVRAEVAIGAGGVPRYADALGHVEHDRDGQHVMLTGQCDELAACVGLHVGGVDDAEPPGGQPLTDDVVQHVERIRGRRLVVLVVGDQTTAEVGGDDLGRLEVRAGERRLARPGDTDQHDQAQLRYLQHTVGHQLALSKTAIWVGGPTSRSSRPTGRCRTR
jgi:hypothetical protein